MSHETRDGVVGIIRRADCVRAAKEHLDLVDVRIVDRLAFYRSSGRLAVEQTRQGQLDERLASRTRGTIAADRLLRAATYDGHRALGWADAGELAVSARADFVAVQTDSIRTAGGGATVENAVFGATAADVTDVVVDGRAVVVDRKHVTVPDVEAELASAITELVEAR